MIADLERPEKEIVQLISVPDLKIGLIFLFEFAHSR